jgi:hypothetical protein
VRLRAKAFFCIIRVFKKRKRIDLYPYEHSVGSLSSNLSQLNECEDINLSFFIKHEILIQKNLLFLNFLYLFSLFYLSLRPHAYLRAYLK